MTTGKIDLHLHLDGSLNIRWAYEKALLREAIDKDMSFEEFYDILYMRNKGHSAENFKKFKILCDVLQTREDLFEATYDLCKRQNDLNMYYIEIRFASQQHCLKGLSQREALKAVIDGAKKAMEDYPIKVGIIDCLMHKGDSVEVNFKENMESVEIASEFLGKGLVGLDLAGYENNCDYKDYGVFFEKAREKGIPFTLHAGEMGYGSHILDALAMKPNRIGHGIDCIQDESYIKALRNGQIPVEVCVSSNVKVDRNYAAHPIRKMIEEGLKVTVNTDNMIFARTNVPNEHEQLKMIGISKERLMQSTYDSLDSAFCDDATKRGIKERLDQYFKQ